jgi:hypothetical protein
MENDDVKLIFSPQLAKHLILKGYVVVDLKQKKENPDATIFVFKNENDLMAEVTNWKSGK